MDGIVISRAVELGQTVASSFNTPTLFQIANDLTKMQIDAAVDEADIGGVRQGASVDFNVEAYPNRIFHGTIIQVRNAPTTVNNVVTYDTVIGVTNADYSLKPGMTASVSIVVARRSHVLEISNAALRFEPLDSAAVATNAPGVSGVQAANDQNRERSRRPAGPHSGRGARGEHEAGQEHTIFVLGAGTSRQDPMLRAVQVRTGITDNIHTEVISGLKEGDEVVTGSAIPGLASAPGARNPFGFGHRF